MKVLQAVIMALIICLNFSSCASTESRKNEYFGFKTSEFALSKEEDTHGGIHGDGSYYLILDCSEKSGMAREIIKDWKTLPLTENLQLLMYGGEKDGVKYSYDFAEEAHWPVVQNGVYKFFDDQNEAVDKSDDTNLFNRYSFNFSIAMYDLDSNIFYYYEIDT